MNVQCPPKEAFGELPQFRLERSENDDDLDDNTGGFNSSDSVRETAAASVFRRRWQFWKKSSLKQKRARQRKCPLPGAVLTPLSTSSSPGRHNLQGVEKIDKFIDDLAESEVVRLSPSCPHSAKLLSLNSIELPLPPLEMQILQRQRLSLDLNGSPTIKIDQLIRLQEYKEPKSPLNALNLAALPKKCVSSDEVALMPCHSLQYRGFEMLSAERWREPIRDRDKLWMQDELPLLLAGNSYYLKTTSSSMTRAPAANNHGKWARYEACRFRVQRRSNNVANAGLVSPVKHSKRVHLRSQGTLISRSYCVVSIFGEGTYGRLYGAGLTGQDKKRCLHVEAYEPATSRTYSLRVTLQDIEGLFLSGGVDPEREALLAPGRKQELLRQLISLLYFEYPADPNTGAGYDDPYSPEEIVKPQLLGQQILRISPEIQPNESALRRLEREERLRQEEARRLEELAALLARPRRARHRVHCQPIKLRGRSFYVSMYHFPAQARNLVIVAYNPSASMTYKLTVGLLEAASIVRLYPYPRRGFSLEQTLTVARGLIPRLRLLGREDTRNNSRMMLAINGGRQGPGTHALPPLLPVMTDELRKEEIFNKMLRVSQQSLQHELRMTQFRLHQEAEAERVEIRQKIVRVEAKRVELTEKDQSHKARIEEIDAIGGGGGTNFDVKHLHEERRSLKTARQALKIEIKSTAAQLAELNKQLQDVSEKENASGDRAQRRADRARKKIRGEVLQTVSASFQEMMPIKLQLPLGQRTWLAKTHMRPGHLLVSSGGCKISGKHLRYSLFVLEEKINDALDDADTNGQLLLLEFYDPGSSMRSTNFVLSNLELVALTKICHEQQQLVSELASPASHLSKRLLELHENMRAVRQSLYNLDNTLSGPSKSNAVKAKASSSKEEREELHHALKAASNEIRKLNRDAPWPTLVKELCRKCTINTGANGTLFEVGLDRCIFRAVSPVLRITNDENEVDNDESSAVYCRVRAEVAPLAKALVFEVWDPFEGVHWRVENPESRELFREFAVETFIEQQMHLEAIVMSLLLHTDAETGRLELRFEE
ncbi:unnamed protein product [Phytophthora fragariaefolia]|uniref:Unnamed protein product n=1 Tax=Phytophthora fragariaefolia TaxID=1490495 RepID=A0A9W7D1W5_9STRA|nr:unnamed protein product [Phytophthora fragariaefolia]